MFLGCKVSEVCEENSLDSFTLGDSVHLKVLILVMSAPVPSVCIHTPCHETGRAVWDTVGPGT